MTRHCYSSAPIFKFGKPTVKVVFVFFANPTNDKL